MAWRARPLCRLKPFSKDVISSSALSDKLRPTLAISSDRRTHRGRRSRMVGTPYKSYTLEIDNHVEAPSVNFYGMDCWTFFEIALGFARMLEDSASEWSPARLLHYVELDRYRDGSVTGEYLSRLHYLEDWLADNDRRGLVNDLTRELGGVRSPHAAHEMTLGWRHYRYLKANRALLRALGSMEARVSERPLYQIPKSRVAQIESKLKSGDIIGIVSRDRPGLYSTSHVGLACRTDDGVLHFMHASSPHNYGRVVVDAAALELSGALSERHWNPGRATAPLVNPRSPSSREPLSRDEQSPFPHPVHTLRASRRCRNPDSLSSLRAGSMLKSDRLRDKPDLRTKNVGLPDKLSRRPGMETELVSNCNFTSRSLVWRFGIGCHHILRLAGAPPSIQKLFDW